MGQLNVFIISQEEPFYIPKVIRYLAEHQINDYKLIGATRLQPHRKNKTMKDWFLERSKLYSYSELFITFFMLCYTKMWYKLLSAIGIYSPYSVKAVYQKYQIKEYVTKDINSEDYLKQISGLEIDVIISISPPQLFEKQLLQLPKVACINAHGTLLPRHRGVFGSWWMLFNEDNEIGTTIHIMVEKLDAGEIIWQQAAPMPKKATQYSIAYHTKKIMAEGLVTTLSNFANNGIQKIDSPYEESYHRAPSKEQGKTFHKKGNRVITWRDTKYALAKSF